MTSVSGAALVHPPSRPLSWAFVASGAAFIAYALGIPALVSVGLSETQPSWGGASIVLLAISVYSAMRLAFELGKGASRWFVMIFHTFTYVFLGVVPLVQIGSGTLLWAVDPAPDVILEAALVCLAGILLFDLGLWIGSSRPGHGIRTRVDPSANAKQPIQRSARDEPRSDGFALYLADRALVLLIGSTVLSLVLLVVRGGLPLVLASRSEMNTALCTIDSSGGLAECGVVSALVRVPPVILTVVALAMRAKGHGSLTWLAIVIGIVSLFITANPVSTARFWVGAVTIGVLGAVLIHSLRARVLLWLALPALLIVVFPLLDFGRDRGWSADFSINLDTVTQKQDFDAFQQIANGITYVDIYGTQGGMQLSSSLLFFIPRSIWNDKAPATGPLVSASLGVIDNTNVSSPLWEEAYVDFGFGGVLVMMSALGLAIARLEAAVHAGLLRRGGLIVVVAPFFAGYGVFVLRGALLPAIGLLAVATLLVWATSRLGSDPRQELEYRRTSTDWTIQPVRLQRAASTLPPGVDGRHDGPVIAPPGSVPRSTGLDFHDA